MKHVSRKAIAAVLTVAVAGLAVAAATAGVSTRRRAAIQACGLMPDTKTSVRWEQFDKPYLEKAFKAAGVSARVVNAQGDPQKQKSQADQCIADGAKVLIIAPIDSGSAAAIEQAALAKGVKSIDYDRQVEGGSRRPVRLVRRPPGRRPAGHARRRRPEGNGKYSQNRSSPS